MSLVSSVAGREAGVVSLPVRPAAAVRVGPRQALYRAGDAADFLFEVVEGAVMLSSGLGDGRRQIVEIARAGAVIGFAAGRMQPLDAETLVASVLRPIGRATLAGDPALEQRVGAAMLKRMAALEEHTLLLGRKAAMERLASFLVWLSEGDRVDLLGLTRQEIGDHLGLAIETVSRNVSRLRGLGVIALDRSGGVRIRDRAALKALSGRGDQTPM